MTFFLANFLALFAGVLLNFAFSPFDYGLCAIIALVIFTLLIHNVSPKTASLRGYLFGLGLFGFGVSWVYVSVARFGGATVFEAILITALFVGFWALFPALTAYLFSKLNRQVNLFLLPSLWVLVEYLRGEWILNGFPWLQVAYSQLDTPLAGYIAVVGSYGTGFMLLMTACLIASFIINRKLIFIFGLLIIWGLAYHLKTQQWTQPLAKPFQVTLLQGNISQDQKWLPKNAEKTMRLYAQMTAEHWDSAVIIWPETAIPAFYHKVQDNYLPSLAKQARKQQTDLVVSLPMRNEGKIYNSVITLGKKFGIYRKNHLLPFGEYMPLQPLSGAILSRLKIRLGQFTSGGFNQPLLEAGGYAFITSICYEDVFGSESIRQLDKAAYLVNVTNDAWFGDSLEPHQHMQIARMRALESGRYLLRATNTGLTGIVNPKGKLIKQAPLFKTTALTGMIEPMTGLTPYAKWGDKPVLVIILLWGVALVFFSFKKYD